MYQYGSDKCNINKLICICFIKNKRHLCSYRVVRGLIVSTFPRKPYLNCIYSTCWATISRPHCLCYVTLRLLFHFKQIWYSSAIYTFNSSVFFLLSKRNLVPSTHVMFKSWRNGHEACCEQPLCCRKPLLSMTKEAHALFCLLLRVTSRRKLLAWEIGCSSVFPCRLFLRKIDFGACWW